MVFHRVVRAGALLAGVLFLSSAIAADGVAVFNAWVRGTVAGQQASGAFMEIRSEAPVRVISVATPVAAKAEIHNMTMENGVMRMFPVKDLELPAGKTVKLAPGGYHVMLTGLKQPLSKGAKVPITLTVEGADRKALKIEVVAEVRDLTAAHH